MDPRVFISYCFEDKVRADELCEALESQGFRVWIAPRDVPSEMDWEQGAKRGMQESGAVLFLHTKRSNTSPAVRRDLEAARATDIGIVDLRMDGSLSVGALERLIEGARRIEAREGDLGEVLIELCGALRRQFASHLLISASKPKPAPAAEPTEPRKPPEPAFRMGNRARPLPESERGIGPKAVAEGAEPAGAGSSLLITVGTVLVFATVAVVAAGSLWKDWDFGAVWETAKSAFVEPDAEPLEVRVVPTGDQDGSHVPDPPVSPPAPITGKDIDAFLEGGEHALQLRQFDLARSSFERVLAVRPEHGRARLGRGLALFADGAYDEAFEDLSHATRFAPEDARSYAARALIHLHMGRAESALTDARQAVKIAPGSAMALAARGAVLLVKGRMDRAIRDSEMALDLDPKSALAWTTLARAHLNMGEYEDARRCVDRAVRAAPDDPVPTALRADIARREGRFDDAIRDAEAAMLLDHGSAVGTVARARIHLARGERVRAKRLALEATRIDDAEPDGWWLRALLAMDTDVDDGLELAGRAVGADPLDPEARVVVALGRLRKDRFDQALAAADRALAIDPYLADARLVKARALRALGRLDEARAEESLARRFGTRFLDPDLVR